MTEFVDLNGEFFWIRAVTPEEFEGKSAWKAMIRPDQESIMKIMDMQAKGVKNKLKKDNENRYCINFSRPTEKKNKKGEVYKKFDPPKVFDTNGQEIKVNIANGAKGTMRLEVYEHPTKMGKSHAAMLHSLTLSEYQEYGTEDAKAEAY